MTRRARICAWVGAVALVVGAIVLLRNDTERRDGTHPDVVDRFPSFADRSVVLPQPAESIPPPGAVRVYPGPGRLRLAWAEALPGGQPLPGVSGYELRWLDQVRMLATPEAQIEGLPTANVGFEVRSIDPFGRRSEPVRVTGTPDGAAPAGQGYVDEFDTTASVRAEVVGSRWHVSGYKGCIDLGADDGLKRGQLIAQLGCGADDVVLRSRSAFRLVSGGGRVTAVTDAAGPRGGVVFDFVPGTPDRIGARNNTEPVLPRQAIRVSISDSGVRVVTGADVPQGAFSPTSVLPASRGSGVLHKFEVVFTGSGLQVLQDGELVANSNVLAPWPEATVLLAMVGPPGRRSRVHLDTVTLSEVGAPPAPVVEFGAVMGTQRVLRPQENAPGIGVTRQPLIGASSARLRTTVTLGAGANPTGMSLEIGDRTIPMTPATPDPPSQPGTDVTLVAELPPDMLTEAGPSQLSPLVIRGGGSGAVFESYLEITPGPASQPVNRPADPRLNPRLPALPAVSITLLNAQGIDLGDTAPVRSPFQLEVTLDSTLTQRDADDVMPVRGFEVFLNERRIAAVPTDLAGPTVAGKYRLIMSAVEQLPGDQRLDVRLHPADRNRRTQSTLFVITLVS